MLTGKQIHGVKAGKCMNTKITCGMEQKETGTPNDTMGTIQPMSNIIATVFPVHHRQESLARAQRITIRWHTIFYGEWRG
jgi:hypothetical protein